MSDILEKLLPFARAKNPLDPEFLEKIPYFSSIFLDKSLWPILVKMAGDDGIALIELKKYPPGKYIISKGRFDQMIYWVVDGEAHILGQIKDQEKVIHKAFKGECIGELGVIKGTPRNADVVAGDQGAIVVEIDWAITEKDPELGKYFYHLLTQHLADKLDKSYSKQLKIIANAIDIINEKTLHVIERNRTLTSLLEKNNISFDLQADIDQEEALTHAIANIRESLNLLKLQESQNNLEKLGLV